MKKVIGIIDQNGIDYDETSLDKGCGGSETWTIQIAHEFSRWGYHVIVFNGSNQYWHFDGYGTEWVPYQMLQSRLDYQQFDYIIITRLYEGLINLISEKNCCKKVIIQCHDWACGYWWPDPNNEIFPNRFHTIDEDPELKSPLIKKIVALSNWHKSSIMDWKKIPEEWITIIPNGIDPTLFDGIDALSEPRDHTILWSSRPERGIYLLCNVLLPLIKERVPDVKVAIASYDPIQDEWYGRESEGIYCLGKLNKSQLYEEMQKHRVWFYPAIYPETFNITSLESSMCGNIPVLPFSHGMATTFAPFEGFFMNSKFHEDYYIPNGNDEEAIPEAVNMISDILLNGDTEIYKRLRKSLRKYVENYYTWYNVVDKYVKLFNEIDKQ